MQNLHSKLKYSEALRPIAAPSSVQTRKFLPTTSGPYTPSNNIIRIPLNANAFVDTKNLMLRFSLKNNSAATAKIDGSAASFIQELAVLSPDGSALSTVQNYGKLYAALNSLEKSRDNRIGISNALEGSTVGDSSNVFTFASTGTAAEVVINGVTLTRGTAGSVAINEYFSIATTAVATDIVVNGVTFTTGVAKSDTIFGLTFATTGTANVFVIGGISFTLGTASAARIFNYSTNNALAAVPLAAGASRVFCVPLVTPLCKLNQLWPALLVGGQGCVIQITCALNADAVFFQSSGTPDYIVDGVEVSAPVINMSDAMVQNMRQALMSTGSLSMSSVDFQNFVYPYSSGTSALSIPIAMRARSLKSVYFFAQSTQSAANYNIPRTSARENIGITSIQLRIGSALYPSSAIQVSTTNVAEAVMELVKSVAKLNDIRLGSAIDYSNFLASQEDGGQALYGIDLEAFVGEIEAGLDTSTNALQMSLELTCAPTAAAGQIQTYCFFDDALSILPNGSVVATK